MKDVPQIVDRVETIAILGTIVIVTTVHKEDPKPRGIRKQTVIVKEKLHQNHFASKRKKLLTTNRHRQTILVPVAPHLPPVQILQVHQVQIHLQIRTAAGTDAQISLHTLFVKYYNDLLHRHSSEWGRDEATYLLLC